METISVETTIDQKVKERLAQTWTTCRPGVLDALQRLEKILPQSEVREEHELAYLHLYVIFINAQAFEPALAFCEVDYFQQKERYERFKIQHPELSAYFDSGI
ncbi:MAG: hypothetical protein ABIJ21_06840 [Nanoarchaeota archaeon]